jgi:predicted DNA-binding ArsR family transcriptional regulator
MAGGRPRKEINYDTVAELANIQCTQEEIASVLKISVRTLQRDEEFCRIYKQGMEEGKQSLRRLQWKAAMKGNTTMLVWLGKQYLGQKDKIETEDKTDNAKLQESLDRFIEKL